MNILSSTEYLERLATLSRAGEQKIYAFYDHRIGGICCDPHLLLMPVDDHLAHRGDGIFESLHYEQGKILQLDAHMARLQSSAAALALTPPCDWEEIPEIIRAVARAGQADQGSIRVLMGRGCGGFGISPEECPQTSLYIIAMQSSSLSESVYRKGFTAFRSRIPAKQSYLAHIKTTNYLPNVLMVAEANARGMDIGFSFDEHDCLAEAAIASVGIVDSSGVLTVPELTSSLPGTTVQRALELARSFMLVSSRPITEEELFKAQEILVFGTGVNCIGVRSYEDSPIGDGFAGPVATRLRRDLHSILLVEGTPF